MAGFWTQGLEGKGWGEGGGRQGVQSELLEQRQSFLSNDTFYELPYPVKPSECLQKSSIFFLFIEY
jgi:hypothetical protein